MTEPVRDSELIIVENEKDEQKRKVIYHLGLRPEQLARQIFVVENLLPEQELIKECL